MINLILFRFLSRANIGFFLVINKINLSINQFADLPICLLSKLMKNYL